MRIEWETIESGPAAAERTVLLLPGGMCSARSYAEVMAEPSLAGYRLVAATLPGHCGTVPPEDFRTEHYAEIAAELARELGADVVVGFSMGAMVAYEMAVSGAFTGLLVLLGASLSSPDDCLLPRHRPPHLGAGRTARLRAEEGRGVRWSRRQLCRRSVTPSSRPTSHATTRRT